MDEIPVYSQQNQLVMNYKKHRSYVLFISSLRAEYTKIKYDGCLKKYLRLPVNSNLSNMDQILRKDPKIIEMELTHLLIDMKNSGMSYSTLSVHLAALYSYFAINDIPLNRKKLSKFVGEQENKYEYRSYTHDEISRLLSLCDERGKVMVLLLTSTGMRIGALPGIELKHLKRYSLHNGYHVYRIVVYPTSKKYRYITFCSPECAEAIDSYLDLRKRIVHKHLKINPETGEWEPPELLLLTKLFDTNHVPFSSNVYMKPMTTMGLRAYIVTRLKKLNLRKPGGGENPLNHIASYKNELHPCHSFRIFAVTQMARSKLDLTTREMLVGHDTGLDSRYNEVQDNDLLEEFLKAVNYLTINNEYRLQQELLENKQKSEGLNEIHNQLSENYEHKLQLFKEEMENKLQLILTKVNMNNLSNG